MARYELRGLSKEAWQYQLEIPIEPGEIVIQSLAWETGEPVLIILFPFSLN